VERARKSGRESGLNQSMICAYVDMSQWSSLIFTVIMC
jgi:hypothetical protein